VFVCLSFEDLEYVMKKLKLIPTKLALRSETVARLHTSELTYVRGARLVDAATDAQRPMCSPHTPGATLVSC
jgi:hypothetical protein